MNVAALAEELDLEPAALLRMCRDRGIRASWEESELSDESVAALREAIRPDDPEHPAEPVTVGANPAVVANFSNLPPTPNTIPAPAPPAAAPATAEPDPDGSVDPAGGPASPVEAPAFGSIDARYASVARPVPEIVDENAPIKHPLTPEVGSGIKSLVVAFVFGGAWVLARLLPHWRYGRWWLVAVVGAVVAGIAALRALVLGVVGVSNVTRYAHARRGRPAAAIITAIAALLLLGGTLLGIYDWTAISIPSAYTRLRHTFSHDQTTTSSQLNQLEATDLSNTIQPEGAAVAGLKVGDCIVVTLNDELSSDTVACNTMHRYEVAGFSSFGEGSYPGSDALKALATESCDGPYTSYVGHPPAGSKYQLMSTYPSQDQWQNGARSGACLVVTDVERNTSVKNTDR